MSDKAEKLKEYIRDIKDFPKEGIIFHDITTLLKDSNGLTLSIDEIDKALGDIEFDLVVGPESRGFLFGMPLAYKRAKGFVPIRKKGKLPADTEEESYELEYGNAIIEVHKDAIKPGERIVIIDDLMATGGTLAAIIRLLERLGAKVVKTICLVELCGLDGRKLIEGYDFESIVKYPDA